MMTLSFTFTFVFLAMVLVTLACVARVTRQVPVYIMFGKIIYLS